jgi:hypothetical protein
MDQELLEKIPEVTDLILPWIGMLISIVLFLWFKDFATQLAKGLAFKHDPHFQEGDLVWLEDEPATIIKIGATQTIFGIVNGRGMIWRFIPNGEIHSVKLEKIVSDKIHYDSEDEEARKLKKLLEDYDRKQDVQIEENKEKDVEQDTKILDLLTKVEQEGVDIRKLIDNLRSKEVRTDAKPN